MYTWQKMRYLSALMWSHSLPILVPVGEALHVIQEGLREDEMPRERTPPSAGYEGDFYEQTQGAAMGSPVSAVVANPYMEFFKIWPWSQPQ